MKLAIIVDSSCGLTKTEANKRGWGYLPLVMNIDGKDYLDGVEMLAEDFYKNISIESNVRTSATPPAIIIDELEKYSKENDLVIVYALSQELSSQTNNIKTFASEFKNVHVVSSMGVAEMIVRDLEVIEKLNESNATKDQLIAKVEELTSHQYGLAVPETLKWLVKGGRISNNVAGMANLLKIVPIIVFNEGKLDKHGVGRVFRKTINNSAVEVAEMSNKDNELIILHGANTDIEEIHASIEANLNRKVEVKFFPPIIALHTGPGVVAIITRKK